MDMLFNLGYSCICNIILIAFCSHWLGISSRHLPDEPVKQESNKRFLLHHLKAENSSEQETACMTTCVDAYKNVTRRCCEHNDCFSLPVSTLIPHIGLCPADGLWLKWGEWSGCTCHGIRVRYRHCHFPAHLPQGQFCTGHGGELDYCGTKTC